MYIIVVGGGKVGYNLVKMLLSEGHEVLLIEKDPVKILALTNEFGEAVTQGNGSRVNVLRDGGANRANVVVAVTGQDEDNLVICQVAKKVFGCRRTIARVSNPRNEEIFHSFGVDATVSSTRLIDSLIEEQVAEDMVIPLVSLGGDVEVVEVEISSSSPVSNKKIREIGVSDDAIFVSIIREEKIIRPNEETELRAGDRVIAVVKKEKEQSLRNIL